MSESEDDRIGGTRGPAYPYIDLRKAVEKASVIADKGAARQAMTPEAFYRLWGMGAKSSASRQTMAALNYYDLVEYVGRGKDRKVKLTDLALRIVLDKRPISKERDEAIREAALSPSIFHDLYQRYAPILPDDVVIETFLRIDRAFSDDAAKVAIRHFRESMEFAQLDRPDSGEPSNTNSPDGEAQSSKPQVNVGDLVQVTVNGIDVFRDGATVIGLSEDGQWAFVDKSNTGVAVENVTVLAHANGPAKSPPLVPEHIANSVIEQSPDFPVKGSRKAIFPLDEGDVTLIFPDGLSKESLNDLSSYLEVFLGKEVRKLSKSEDAT